MDETLAADPSGDETTWPHRPGFAPIPDWLIFHEDVSGTDAVVYMALSIQGPSVTMSHQQIAGKARLSPASVGAVLRRLVRVGALRITPRFAGGGREANHYDLAWLSPFVFPFAGEVEGGTPASPRGPGEGPVTNRRRLERVAKADGGWFCHYCGEPVTDGREGLGGERLHLDHVLPRSRGGGDRWSNRALSCPPCNLSKSAQTPEEWLGEVCCERHLGLTPTRHIESSN